jgi:hypothetical protein
MDQDEALRALDDVEVVPCLSAPIRDAKELLTACLEHEIPAFLDRGDCCDSGGGCAPKVELLVRPDDLPRVAALLQSRWQGMLEREGTLEEAGAAGVEAPEAPCPACGHAAPLDAGACAGCGLQLT